jgi:hypothetical protein
VHEDYVYFCEYTERELCSHCFNDSHVCVNGENYHIDSDEVVETYQDGNMLREDCGYCEYHYNWFPVDEIVHSEFLGESYHEDEVTRVLVNLDGEEDYVLNNSFSTTEYKDGHCVDVWDGILDEYDEHIKELKQKEDDE